MRTTALCAAAVAGLLAAGCEWESQEGEPASPAGRLAPGYGELEPSRPSVLGGEPVPPEDRPPPDGTGAPAGGLAPGYGELQPSNPSPLTGEPTGAPAGPAGP